MGNLICEYKITYIFAASFKYNLTRENPTTNNYCPQKIY